MDQQYIIIPSFDAIIDEIDRSLAYLSEVHVHDGEVTLIASRILLKRLEEDFNKVPWEKLNDIMLQIGKLAGGDIGLAEYHRRVRS